MNILWGESNSFENFGGSVALSADGNRLIAAGLQGIARVYDFNGSQWVQIGQRVGGNSVAISDNGARIVMGTPERDSVSIRDWNGSNWLAIGDVVTSEAEGDLFGSSVAISGDGMRMVVGAPLGNRGDGYTRIFDWTGDEWLQIINIEGDTTDGEFGSNVDLSDDGNLVAITDTQGARVFMLGRLVLQNNIGDDLAIRGNGSFAFSQKLENLSDYSVSVLHQPINPNQTCLVNDGTGTLAGADISDVSINCVIDTFTIGGTVSGLEGSGLVLQNNSGDDLAISADGSFTFATPLVGGSAYTVTVLTQPSGLNQTCSVTNGSGTLDASDVTDVSVTCVTDTFTVGGTISGLAGTGLVLQNNAGDNLAIGVNGQFTFTTPLEDGSAYTVTVLSQPTGLSQTCTVTNGNSALAGSNVTDLTVNCITNSLTVGGAVSGLAGSGLVLLNNGGDELIIDTDGGFTFATPLLDGTGYNVSIASQPTNLNQTCSVSNGDGALSGFNITNIVVTCTTDTFTIGGSVSGLDGAGLVLQNNTGDNLAVDANGGFVFTTPLADGSTYDVTILTQPSNLSQACTVTNGSGTLTGVNVTNVAVTCSTNTFTIGGTVTGLAGTGLVLQNNGGDDLPIETDGGFTFASALEDGSGYDVSVASQPTDLNQTCSVFDGSGTLAGSSVSNITVTCATKPNEVFTDSFEDE